MGEFKLGIIPTVMPTLLPMFLNTFVNKHPKINLKIQELNTDNIITQLKEAKIDAGIQLLNLNMTTQKNVLYTNPLWLYPRTTSTQ